MSLNQSTRRMRVLPGCCLALCLVAACASTRKLAEPVPVANARPIAGAADSRVAATIDAVIVRDGPGAWAKSADWDEYLIRAKATTDAPVEITGVAIVDSLDERHERETYRRELLKQSKKTARRYKDQDLEVTAGLGAAGVFFPLAAAPWSNLRADRINAARSRRDAPRRRSRSGAGRLAATCGSGWRCVGAA